MFHDFPLILYHRPIEELNFTPQTTSYLLKNGIISIGDCLDFFISRKQNNATALIAQQSLQVMYGEVLEVLKKSEYWSIVADDGEL